MGSLNQAWDRISPWRIVRRSYASRIERVSRERIQRFWEIDSIPDELKQSLETSIGNAYERSAAENLWTEIIERAIGVLFGLMLLGTFSLSPLIARSIFHFDLSGVHWSLLFFGCALVSVGLAAPMFFVSGLSRYYARSLEHALTISSAVVVAASAYPLALLGGRTHWPFWKQLLVVTSVSYPLYIACVLTVSVLIAAARYMLSRALAIGAPQRHLVAHLADLLVELDEIGSIDAPARPKLTARLEGIARFLERDLCWGIRHVDRETAEWAARECRQFAGAVRALKRKVLLPSTKSRDELMAKMYEYLPLAAAGRWQDLDKGFARTANAPPTMSPLRRGLLAVVLAALPLVGFVALQASSYSLDGSARSYATGAVILWTFANLVLAIDPHIAERIATARELKAEIRSARGE